MNLPTIPAKVPFCHRNYEIAEQLAKRSQGETEINRPWFTGKNAFDAVVKAFDAFMESNPAETQNPWEYVEEFFHEMKEKAEQDNTTSSEGIALAQMDFGDDDSEQQQDDTETLLDLSEPQDRETRELHDRVVKDFSNVSHKELIRNAGKIKAAVNKSFSFQKSRKTKPDSEHRDFDIKDIESVREMARINEKYLHAVPEYEDLMLYRAIRGELTTLKSVEPAKKTLFVMIDDSGSMNEGAKKALVNLALYKIREQLDENTEAYIFSFENDLYDEYTILSKKLPNMSFGGSGTNIGGALQSLYKRMQSFNLDKYSILIINDGQDNPGTQMPPCKVSALMLKQQNEQLTSLVEKSGGVAYKLT